MKLVIIQGVIIKVLKRIKKKKVWVQSMLLILSLHLTRHKLMESLGKIYLQKQNLKLIPRKAQT